MCGLFGYSFNPANPPSPAQRAIIAFALADEMEGRGRDACGFATCKPDDKGDEVVFYRRETGAYTSSGLLVETCEALNLIGHTRFATVGAKIQENAHPFYIGTIVGAHNGGIFNYKDIAKKYPKRDYDVDSMHLIAHIAEGLDTKELEGYGSVEWYDTRDMGAIRLCKMRRGDLEVEVLADDMGVVWASTRNALARALRAVKMYVASKQFHVSSDKVYRVLNGKIEKTNQEISLKQFDFTTTVGHKSSSTTTTTSSPTTGLTIIDGNGSHKPKQPAGFTHYYGGYKGKYWNDDAQEAYERACKTYNREQKELEHAVAQQAGSECGLSKRDKKRFFKLLARTEHHNATCSCVDCLEVFRLASMYHQTTEPADNPTAKRSGERR